MNPVSGFGADRVNRLCISRHAVQRALARRHYGDLESWKVKQEIYFAVIAALDAGRVSETKPPWTRLFGLEARPARKAGQVFVWDEHEVLCWIVSREDGRDVVVTAMHRARQTISEEAA